MTKDKFLSRLKDPYTYLGLGSFGSVAGINEIAAFGVPGVATGIAATVGILAALFGSTTEEKKAEKAGEDQKQQ